jgi:arylsulfatase A-like enzyme
MQGQSWLPLLEGSARAVRSGFLYEYFRNRFTPMVPRIVAFRRGAWKLIEYPDYPEYGREFYNLRSDPWETLNRIDDPAVRAPLATMTRAMRDAAASLGYRIPPGADRQR